MNNHPVPTSEPVILDGPFAPEFIRMADFATIMGFTPELVRRLRAAGMLPSITYNGEKVVPVSHLDAIRARAAELDGDAK